MDDTDNPLLGPGPGEELASEGLHVGRVVNLQTHLSLHLEGKENKHLHLMCSFVDHIISAFLLALNMHGEIMR